MPSQSASGGASGSGLMNTNPAQVPTRTSGTAHGLRLQVGELPGGGHPFEPAVEVPGESVEGAADLGAPPGVALELPATVEAGVGVGLDLVGRGADHEVRPAGDVVDNVVADLRDVLLPAGHLPYPGPQPFLFQFVGTAGRVPLDGHRGRAEPVAVVGPQLRRDWLPVGLQDLLVGQRPLAGQRRMSFQGVSLSEPSSRGSPRTRSPMMLRWTCDVPPAMVWAGE